eukprot:scaffold9.g3282.t1
MGATAALVGDSGVSSWLLLCFVSLIVGWLLPRPRFVRRGRVLALSLLSSTPLGRWIRALMLAAHGALILKAVWREFFAVGTARGVARALWLSLTTGRRFEWPSPGGAASGGADSAAPAAAEDSWYVTDAELQQLKWAIEQDGRPEGAGAWEHIMARDLPGATYAAWRRSVPGGKTEYKSVTVAEDATAEEFMDFYLDDDSRPKWDGMISEHQLLAAGDLGARQQVVRWVRTFPFAFISQREYVIARRMWRAPDGALYAVTRGVAHPSAPADGRMVRMESYYSCWRSRTVPCPRGSGRPACETVLLHFEDFKVNERLARFAVRHGMASFVKSMVPEVQRFVAERRARCDPSAEDPQAYGARAPLRALPLGRCPSEGGPCPGLDAAGRAASLSSAASSLGPEDSAYGSDGERAAPAPAAGAAARLARSPSAPADMQRSPSMRRLGYVMVASSVAYAIARTASSSNLSGGGGAAPAAGGRRHGGGGGKAAPGAGGTHGGAHKHRGHGQKHGGGHRRHHARQHAAAPVAEARE